MNLKRLYKKGFTLIELVVAIAISLVLFSILGNILYQSVNNTKIISNQENETNGLYYFENFVRDDLTSSIKVKKNNLHGFVFTMQEEGKEKTFYYDLSNNKILRKDGNNVLLSNVKKYNVKYNNSCITMDILLFSGTHRIINIEVRAEEV